MIIKKLLKLCDNWVIWSSARPFIASFLFGICSTLTLAPFFLFPLIIPAYGGLFYLLKQAQTRKRAALVGFFWGWGFQMSGLYYLVIALLTNPEEFAWLIPFALFGLTAVFALYTVVFSVAFFYTKRALLGIRHETLCMTLSFALLWLIVEYARGHLFTGFPWHFAGYAFGASNATIQLASVLGIYGLTFFAVLLGAVWATNKRHIIAVWALFFVAMVWGVVRLQAPTEYVEGVKLRLVQPNILQHHRWKPEKQYPIFSELTQLTRSAGLDKVTHVIWPETAVPWIFTEKNRVGKMLGELIPPSAQLIVGTMRYEDGYYNSIIMFNHTGKNLGYYDKHKLVPFGEYLPLRWLLPDIVAVVAGEIDMLAGKAGVTTENWQGLPPVSPLICYEVLFPELAVNKQHPPQWLLTVTNDAWFGRSTAPYQHLEMARMRAVEHGLPLVRVANTGISAVYDAYGRKLAEIPLMTKGYLDVDLPKPLQNRTTYARFLY